MEACLSEPTRSVDWDDGGTYAIPRQQPHHSWVSFFAYLTCWQYQSKNHETGLRGELSISTLLH